jgi:hypothetical protein
MTLSQVFVDFRHSQHVFFGRQKCVWLGEFTDLQEDLRVSLAAVRAELTVAERTKSC